MLLVQGKDAANGALLAAQLLGVYGHVLCCGVHVGLLHLLVLWQCLLWAGEDTGSQ